MENNLENNSKVGLPIIIAVTGGIATGKSTVCEILKNSSHYNRNYNYNCLMYIDLDTVAKTLWQEDDVLAEIYLLLEKYKINKENKINKIKLILRELMFNNPDIKKDVENIFHPKIKNWVFNKINKVSKISKISEKLENNNNLENNNLNKKYILIGIPLLQKGSTWLPYFSYIINVQTPMPARLAHLKTRGLSSDLAQKIIAQQPSEQAFQEIADYTIYNNKGLDELKKAVDIAKEHMFQYIS